MICNPILEPLIGGCNETSGGIALAVLIARLYRAALIAGGLALLLYIAWGGISWITAGGDKAKVEEAQNRIKNAIIGMTALVATVAIAIFLSSVFGFDILDPTVPGAEN